METNTIIQIRAAKETLLQNLETYKNATKNSGVDRKINKYGSEQEYCINGLIGGIGNILTDISYLVKSHDYFIKISTYTERNNILTHLNSLIKSLSQYATAQNHAQIAVSLDTLKVVLRSYNLRLDKDRLIEFNGEIDNLRKKATLLDEDITQTKSRTTESEAVLEEVKTCKASFDTSLEEILQKKKELETIIEAFQNKYGDFETLAESATENESTISEKLEEVNESKKLIDGFVNQIDKREKQLTEQANKTIEYEMQLQTYSDSQNKIEEDAKKLIDNAIKALNYSNATGLSAAYASQHDIANNKHNKVWWLTGAGFFIVATLLIGIWILTGWGIHRSDDSNLIMMNLIGRLSLIPFTVLAALFCANQYVKQKNIIEDYAYKTVLAKSIVAFSEELRAKEPIRYAEYLSTVLKEIHQDPLRKRAKEKDDVSLKDTTGLFDKIVELVKECTKQ
jgi:hypothetical protein